MTGWLLIAGAAVGWALLSFLIAFALGRAARVLSPTPRARITPAAAPLVPLDLENARHRRRRGTA